MKTHKISLLAAILINMNIMIGAGIYISPPQMAALAGEFSFLGWVLSAIVFLPVVISLSYLSRLYPGEGGIYSYAKRMFGPFVGFFGGWSYFLGFVGAEALQVTVLRQSFYHSFQYSWLQEYPWIFNSVLLLFLFGLCTFSIRQLAILQNGLTFLKILPLVTVISLFFIFPSLGDGQMGITVNDSKVSLLAILQVTPLAMFGFWGFEACSNISHRIRGNKRNASYAIIISFLLVSLIYSCFHYELLNVMGPDALYRDKVDGFASYLGISYKYVLMSTSVIVIILCLSYFNAIFSSLISYSFLLQAMAKDSVLLGSKLISKSNQNAQPIFGVAVNISIAFLLATFVSDLQALVALTNIGILIAFLICLVGLFRWAFFGKNYGILIAAFFGICSCVIIMTVSFFNIKEIKDLAPFVVFLSIGWVSYLLQKQKRRA